MKNKSTCVRRKGTPYKGTSTPGFSHTPQVKSSRESKLDQPAWTRGPTVCGIHTHCPPEKNPAVEQPDGPRIQYARPQCRHSEQRVFWRAQATILVAPSRGPTALAHRPPSGASWDCGSSEQVPLCASSTVSTPAQPPTLRPSYPLPPVPSISSGPDPCLPNYCSLYRPILAPFSFFF